MDPDETLHNCLALSSHLLIPCDTLLETPLTNTYFSWVTDGSYLKDGDGKYAVYAVAAPFEIVESAPLPLATHPNKLSYTSFFKLVP